MREQFAADHRGATVNVQDLAADLFGVGTHEKGGRMRHFEFIADRVPGEGTDPFPGLAQFFEAMNGARRLRADRAGGDGIDA